MFTSTSYLLLLCLLLSTAVANANKDGVQDESISKEVVTKSISTAPPSTTINTTASNISVNSTIFNNSTNTTSTTESSGRHTVKLILLVIGVLAIVLIFLEKCTICYCFLFHEDLTSAVGSLCKSRGPSKVSNLYRKSRKVGTLF